MPYQLPLAQQRAQQLSSKRKEYNNNSKQRVSIKSLEVLDDFDISGLFWYQKRDVYDKILEIGKYDKGEKLTPAEIELRELERQFLYDNLPLVEKISLAMENSKAHIKAIEEQAKYGGYEKKKGKSPSEVENFEIMSKHNSRDGILEMSTKRDGILEMSTKGATDSRQLVEASEVVKQKKEVGGLEIEVSNTGSEIEAKDPQKNRWSIDDPDDMSGEECTTKEKKDVEDGTIEKDEIVGFIRKVLDNQQNSYVDTVTPGVPFHLSNAITGTMASSLTTLSTNSPPFQINKYGLKDAKKDREDRLQDEGESPQKMTAHDFKVKMGLASALSPKGEKRKFMKRQQGFSCVMSLVAEDFVTGTVKTIEVTDVSPLEDLYEYVYWYLLNNFDHSVQGFKGWQDAFVEDPSNPDKGRPRVEHKDDLARSTDQTKKTSLQDHQHTAMSMTSSLLRGKTAPESASKTKTSAEKTVGKAKALSEKPELDPEIMALDPSLAEDKDLAAMLGGWWSNAHCTEDADSWDWGSSSSSSSGQESSGSLKSASRLARLASSTFQMSTIDALAPWNKDKIMMNKQVQNAKKQALQIKNETDRLGIDRTNIIWKEGSNHRGTPADSIVTSGQNSSRSYSSGVINQLRDDLEDSIRRATSKDANKRDTIPIREEKPPEDKMEGSPSEEKNFLEGWETPQPNACDAASQDVGSSRDNMNIQSVGASEISSPRSSGIEEVADVDYSNAKVRRDIATAIVKELMDIKKVNRKLVDDILRKAERKLTKDNPAMAKRFSGDFIYATHQLEDERAIRSGVNGVRRLSMSKERGSTIITEEGFDDHNLADAMINAVQMEIDRRKSSASKEKGGKSLRSSSKMSMRSSIAEDFAAISRTISGESNDVSFELAVVEQVLMNLVDSATSSSAGSSEAGKSDRKDKSKIDPGCKTDHISTLALVEAERSQKALLAAKAGDTIPTTGGRPKTSSGSRKLSKTNSMVESYGSKTFGEMEAQRSKTRKMSAGGKGKMSVKSKKSSQSSLTAPIGQVKTGEMPVIKSSEMSLLSERLAERPKTAGNLSKSGSHSDTSSIKSSSYQSSGVSQSGSSGLKQGSGPLSGSAAGSSSEARSSGDGRARPSSSSSSYTSSSVASVSCSSGTVTSSMAAEFRSKFDSKMRALLEAEDARYKDEIVANRKHEENMRLARKGIIRLSALGKLVGPVKKRFDRFGSRAMTYDFMRYEEKVQKMKKSDKMAAAFNELWDLTGRYNPSIYSQLCYLARKDQRYLELFKNSCSDSYFAKMEQQGWIIDKKVEENMNVPTRVQRRLDKHRATSWAENREGRLSAQELEVEPPPEFIPDAQKKSLMPHKKTIAPQGMSIYQDTASTKGNDRNVALLQVQGRVSQEGAESPDQSSVNNNRFSVSNADTASTAPPKRNTTFAESITKTIHPSDGQGSESSKASSASLPGSKPGTVVSKVSDFHQTQKLHPIPDLHLKLAALVHEKDVDLAIDILARPCNRDCLFRISRCYYLTDIAVYLLAPRTFDEAAYTLETVLGSKRNDNLILKKKFIEAKHQKKKKEEENIQNHGVPKMPSFEDYLSPIQKYDTIKLCRQLYPFLILEEEGGRDEMRESLLSYDKFGNIISTGDNVFDEPEYDAAGNHRASSLNYNTFFSDEFCNTLNPKGRHESGNPLVDKVCQNPLPLLAVSDTSAGFGRMIKVLLQEGFVQEAWKLWRRRRTQMSADNALHVVEGCLEVSALNFENCWTTEVALAWSAYEEASTLLMLDGHTSPIRILNSPSLSRKDIADIRSESGVSALRKRVTDINKQCLKEVAIIGDQDNMSTCTSSHSSSNSIPSTDGKNGVSNGVRMENTILLDKLEEAILLVLASQHLFDAAKDALENRMRVKTLRKYQILGLAQPRTLKDAQECCDKIKSYGYGDGAIPAELGAALLNLGGLANMKLEDLAEPDYIKVCLAMIRNAVDYREAKALTVELFDRKGIARNFEIHFTLYRMACAVRPEDVIEQGIDIFDIHDYFTKITAPGQQNTSIVKTYIFYLHALLTQEKTATGAACFDEAVRLQKQIELCENEPINLIEPKANEILFQICAREGRISDFKVLFFDIYLHRSWILEEYEKEVQAKAALANREKNKNNAEAIAKGRGKKGKVGKKGVNNAKSPRTKEDKSNPETPKSGVASPKTGAAFAHGDDDGEEAERSPSEKIGIPGKNASPQEKKMWESACRERVNTVPAGWSKSPLEYGLDCCATYSYINEIFYQKDSDSESSVISPKGTARSDRSAPKDSARSGEPVSKQPSAAKSTKTTKSDETLKDESTAVSKVPKNEKKDEIVVEETENAEGNVDAEGDEGGEEAECDEEDEDANAEEGGELAPEDITATVGGEINTEEQQVEVAVNSQEADGDPQQADGGETNGARNAAEKFRAGTQNSDAEAQNSEPAEKKAEKIERKRKKGDPYKLEKLKYSKRNLFEKTRDGNIHVAREFMRFLWSYTDIQPLQDFKTLQEEVVYEKNCPTSIKQIDSLKMNLTEIQDRMASKERKRYLPK